MCIARKILCVCVMAAVLVMAFPVSSLATDPVSAATMANAMAQAITAYGASQGVSMTFDVTDTDGIGDGVHDLWDQFVEDVNDPNTPTYDSLAVTMWSNLYSKIGNNLGINISASVMPYIDSFWNWLLSGPAEMTKVDNQYFQWSIDQNGTVSPISVISSNGLAYLPSVISSATQQQVYDAGLFIFSLRENSHDTERHYCALESTVYCFRYADNYDDHNIAFVSETHSSVKGAYFNYGNDRYYFAGTIDVYVNDNGIYYNYTGLNTNAIINPDIPYFADLASGLSYYRGTLDGTNPVDEISVQPYIGDAVPQDVYIPDTTDVNYDPVDVAIPLDIPWDNTLFGDGSGVLTDAQSEAAVSAADSAITDTLEKTLTIADTENPDIPAPNEVFIPLLPVELPSFNFSLSGIWHYVVSWVQSLGAWLSLMFQTWAVLPSAITIPVYATAVIVIVLGVYKRFFM